MGEAKKKLRLDPEEAKVLPARVALSLISSRIPDADEEASGGGEEPLGAEDRSESARSDPASPDA